MKYRLLLTNTADGDEREITVPAHLPVEDLSPKIKVEFQLPYCDYGWHRFISHGTTYIIKEHFIAEQEILFECDLDYGPYEYSEETTLYDVFTVLGSSILYLQDRTISDATNHMIRITLMERI
jgi:hypothetical protein